MGVSCIHEIVFVNFWVIILCPVLYIKNVF